MCDFQEIWMIYSDWEVEVEEVDQLHQEVRQERTTAPRI